MTEALFEKKAVLLTGNTGVGKTYLAKKISEKLVERKYSCFPSSKDQIVNVEIISCHNSVTYEEIIGGITADTDSGKMFFEYKDKIFLETIIRAASDYNEGKGTKYVLIMDDLQRNDVSTLIGDAVNAIGLEGEEGKLCLNSGMVVEIPPNFYIIGTYNAAETGAILLPSDLISKFYVREILSEIEYVTEDLETENAIYYDQVRSLVLNYLDIQYRRSTYDQSRYFLGHGYEDFVRGIKVSTKPGSDTILYETVNKVLGNIAELAKKHEKTKFFLIIDEINRANLATVFGELIYGLEYRTEQVATPYSVDNNNRISIPDIFELFDLITDGKKQVIFAPNNKYFDEVQMFKWIMDRHDSDYEGRIQADAYLGFVLTNKTSIADSDKFGRQLKDWMRVMTTLSRETNYNGGDDYERAISKGVRRLLPYSSDIISHLAEITEYSGYGFDSDCFEEECLKAKLMKRDDEWKELILNAEDNKYFNGQIGFLLEAAGILSKYENGEIDGWTAEEDKNSKNAFRKYLKIYGSIFGEFEYGSKKEKYVGINRSFANNLRRALLCKGDYHLDDSNNSSFLVDFDRDISWKRLLRIQSNEKHGTYKTRRKMLMDLINDPLFDINDIGGGLINICNRDIGKITNWRKYFISVPGVMDALHDYSAYKPKERYIRIEGDNIFLMGSTRLYGYNKEYYSFALCCMLECLGKYSVRYEDAKGWEDIHHQIEVTEKSTGEVYEIKYRRSDKKFSIYKKDGSATVYANLEDTFNALK